VASKLFPIRDQKTVNARRVEWYSRLCAGVNGELLAEEFELRASYGVRMLYIASEVNDRTRFHLPPGGPFLLHQSDWRIARQTGVNQT